MQQTEALTSQEKLRKNTALEALAIMRIRVFSGLIQ